MTTPKLDAAGCLIIDFEASGLHPDSWPTELAWGDPVTGTIESRLIRPVPDWTHWDPAAEKLTGLTRAHLDQSGKEPASVLADFVAAAEGRILVTDAPRFDAFWLQRLIDGAGIAARFTMAHAEEFFYAAARDAIPDPAQPDRDAMRIDRQREVLISAAKERAREISPPTHRAGADVAHHLATLRLILGQD